AASALDETQRRTPSVPAAPAVPAASADADDEATLLRRPVVVAPDAGSAQPGLPAPVAPPAAADAAPGQKRSGMPWWGWVVAALGVAALVLGIAFSGALTDALVPDPELTPSDTPEPQDPI